MAPSIVRWCAWIVGTVSPLITAVTAKTVTYDWTIGWTTAAPDGFQRRVIGINGKWPLPNIECDVGDRVIIQINNQLPNETTGLHFHGLYMQKTVHMDGPSMVTQCDIAPGQRFTYDFTISQPGTYWYHSHTHGQYPDGLRGAIVVHVSQNPFKKSYDQEIVLTVSDWYHEETGPLISHFLSPANPEGKEPVPNSALINDAQNVRVQVQPNKTYMVRIINVAAFASHYVWFEDHDFEIIEVDGVYTQPARASMIYIASAQRYTVLLRTKMSSEARGKNYAFVAAMDQGLFDNPTSPFNPNVTGWLTYNQQGEFPPPKFVDKYNEYDDLKLVPFDRQPLLPNPTKEFVLNVGTAVLADGASYFNFNNITYTLPKVPTLYTLLSAGKLANNPRVYGTYTSPLVVQQGDVVQIVLNNNDMGRHPFHMHGRAFQSLYRSPPQAGAYAQTGNALPPMNFPQAPMRRDTVIVEALGNIVLRFRADNPGVWLFHCHIEWHMISGLVVTFIESPFEVQKFLERGEEIPRNHYENCRALNVPTRGNAAGNTKDFLDLSGENVPGMGPGRMTNAIGSADTGVRNSKRTYKKLGRAREKFMA